MLDAICATNVQQSYLCPYVILLSLSMLWQNWHSHLNHYQLRNPSVSVNSSTNQKSGMNVLLFMEREKLLFFVQLIFCVNIHAFFMMNNLDCFVNDLQQFCKKGISVTNNLSNTKINFLCFFFVKMLMNWG